MVLRVEERESGICIVTLEGYVDFSTSPQLRAALRRIGGGNVDLVIVDCSRVEYIDSSGIATLVEAHKQSQKRNYRLVLAEVSPPIEAAFELANLKSIFLMSPSVEAALRDRNGE